MDVQLILQVLEQHGLLRLNKMSGKYYQVYCPHHNNGNERRPSCGVLLEDEYKNGSLYPKGWWHCFSCGYVKDMKGSIDDILSYHDIKMTSEEWLIANVPGYTPEDNEDNDDLIPLDMINSIESKYALDQLSSLTQPKMEFISEKELASYRYTVPYMYERGLTDELIEKYDIGYDANFKLNEYSKPLPCITFPVHDINGNTLFFCRRAIHKKLYHYPEDVTKPLYGIDKIPKDTKSLLIVESCINCLTAVSYGYPAVALMGTGNSYQASQLKSLQYPSYVLCFDGDAPGQKASKRLKKQLSKSAIIWEIKMPEGKDVNDLTKEEFDELYRNKE